jgi:hypothetical protein
MKKIFLSVVLFTTIGTAKLFAQAEILSPVLNSYYSIKNALVNGDAATASAKATNLVDAIDAVDKKALTVEDHHAFIAVQEKLKSDAQAIASSKKIEAQRTTFSSLSNNIYTLAKAVKLSVEPVYQQYCPMKKMYWLSDEAAIKNPYYGKMMLTCGKVTDTLK